MDILKDLIGLSNKDVSTLLALFLVLIGLYVVIDKLTKFPSNLAAWRKRRRGEAPIDPHLETQRLMAVSLARTTEQEQKLSDAIAMLAKNQATNIDIQGRTADATKQLVDRGILMEDLVKQNIAAMEGLTAATNRNSELASINVKILTGAMQEMRGAQGAIVNAIAEQVSTHTSTLTATVNGAVLVATDKLQALDKVANGNAQRLAELGEGMERHRTMIERMQKLLEGIPTREDLQRLLAGMQTIENENATLKAKVAVLEAENEKLKEQAKPASPDAPVSDAPTTPTLP